MYAIRNKNTGEWVYGTDYRYSPTRQRTSSSQALTYEDWECAEMDLKHRKCGKDYEIVKVSLIEANDG